MRYKVKQGNAPFGFREVVGIVRMQHACGGSLAVHVPLRERTHGKAHRADVRVRRMRHHELQAQRSVSNRFEVPDALACSRPVAQTHVCARGMQRTVADVVWPRRLNSWRVQSKRSHPTQQLVT